MLPLICVHLRSSADPNFSTAKFLNPPAIPFSGFSKASPGTGPCELGIGESKV